MHAWQSQYIPFKKILKKSTYSGFLIISCFKFVTGTHGDSHENWLILNNNNTYMLVEGLTFF